jgi:hypothetical protein
MGRRDKMADKNVTYCVIIMRPVRVDMVSMEKKNIIIVWVLLPWLTGMQSSCAVFYLGIAICGPSCLPYFSQLPHERHDFRT